MTRQNIFVVGLMAVGKSTVGRMLADSLDMPFYDSDHEIEARAGAEVSWIFDVEGESGFRDREEQVIDELTQLQGVVIATGGGVVKRQINRRRLAARGTVLHLDCPIKKLLARTRKDKKRPLLLGDDREHVLTKLMCERGPLYAEIADYRFVSTEQSARALVRQIERKLTDEGIL
ncbi:MAG: shikimate kinase AroK [Gammaproteobacteria bacterium]|nr:shikimate kinase AroK [Gammaproteobacteria bacterium]